MDPGLEVAMATSVHNGKNDIRPESLASNVAPCITKRMAGTDGGESTRYVKRRKFTQARTEGRNSKLRSDSDSENEDESDHRQHVLVDDSLNLQNQRDRVYAVRNPSST